MFEAIKNNTVIWIILASCTVGSLLYAIITRAKDKKKRQIAYARRSNYIVSKNKKSIERLNLTFDGKEINDLTVTKFAIWNRQDIEIRREDIATDCQLKIKSIGEAEILDAEIILENEKTNKFSILSLDNKEVVFDFEYMDEKNGIVVQIIHTGDKKDLKVECKIKGGAQLLPINEKSDLLIKAAKKIPRKHLEKIYITLIILGNLAFTSILVLLVLEIIGVIHESVINNNGVSSFPLWGKIVICVIMMVDIIFMWTISVLSIRKALNVKVPIEFRDYV